MTRTIGHLTFIALVFLGVAYLATTAYAAPSDQGLASREKHMAVCPKGGSDDVHCHAHVVTDANGAPKAAQLPSGLAPADFHAAYAPATTAPSKTIIAIVDAYDDPNIASDLATYSTTYGLPKLPSCNGPIKTATNFPCFSKVSQTGTSKYPAANAGWSLEIALDVEAAHAMCQNCGIVLVEATTNSFANLMTAVDQAATQGATVISNSYGGSEFSTETSYDSHFNRPGVAITVSSGDAGYGVEYPAASKYVTAVGGTTLTLTNGSYVGETAWNGAGSGCSSYEGKPSFQTDTGCANRTVSDVSAVADPATGAAVYDTVRYQGRSGWFKVGGTSLAAPLVAGVYALGGVPTGSVANSLPYGAPSALHDILTGSNGSCSGSYLCTALAGYDGPTGLGSPKGTTAF